MANLIEKPTVATTQNPNNLPEHPSNTAIK